MDCPHNCKLIRGAVYEIIKKCRGSIEKKLSRRLMKKRWP